MEFRTARAGDAPLILALWDEADAQPSSTDDIASIEGLIAHDPEALILADDDGRIVGSVIAAWDGWRGSVYRLAVAPSHRRRGLGRALVGTAQERLARAGAVRSAALVVRTDEQAMAFWEVSDWNPQPEILRFTHGAVPNAGEIDC